MMALSKKQLSEFNTILSDLHRDLSAQVESGQAATDTVVLDQSKVGRLSRMDAMQQQKMAQSTLRNITSRLQLVNVALAKMNAGDYGFCDECGEVIDPGRLTVQPEAPCCFACQSQQEYHPQS